MGPAVAAAMVVTADLDRLPATVEMVETPALAATAVSAARATAERREARAAMAETAVLAARLPASAEQPGAQERAPVQTAH